MKTNKILTFLTVLTLSFFITSCVEDDDFGIPNVTIVEPDISALGQLTTFAAVIQRYLDADADGDNVGVFDDNDIALYIEGYVVSGDKSGNFFEEIIVQNSPDGNDAGSDARRGLKVEINVRSLSDTYEFGRKVYIKLNGLAVGEENGVYTLGKANGNNLEQLQDFEYQSFIFRSAEVAAILPKVTTIGDLTEADENTFIQLDNMQINRDELDKTFAGEADDQFDGFRTLENCDTNATILLQTSTFSDFKSAPLPINQGTIQAIFTRDFGDDNNVLVINSTADIVFENTERCDPIELDCGIASSVGSNNLFSDDFETQTTNSLISGNGWTNFIQEGTEGFEAYSAGGTNSSLGISARVGSFNSGDASSIAWLITPEIDFDAQTGETLNFMTSNSFSDGSTMELLFSTDWDGNPANIVSATWGVLPAAYIVQDSDFFGSWFDSENVDLSCAEGTIHIAFRYNGSGQADMDGTFELDEISIDSE
jgi:Family of unknown function (DUF5689)